MSIDLLIIGAGGNGQTYFMDFCIKNGLKINHLQDRDGLKHLSRPERLRRNLKINKCIFLYNEPVKAVLSHYRRKWAFTQIGKLGNPFSLRSADVNTIDKYVKLAVKNNKDVFGIEYQFNNWVNSRTLKFPILFLDFNDIANKKVEIDAFLQTHLKYDLYDIRPRKSNCEDIDPEFAQIYDDLYNKMTEMSTCRNNNSVEIPQITNHKYKSQNHKHAIL